VVVLIASYVITKGKMARKLESQVKELYKRIQQANKFVIDWIINPDVRCDTPPHYTSAGSAEEAWCVAENSGFAWAVSGHAVEHLMAFVHSH